MGKRIYKVPNIDTIIVELIETRLKLMLFLLSEINIRM